MQTILKSITTFLNRRRTNRWSQKSFPPKLFHKHSNKISRTISLIHPLQMCHSISFTWFMNKFNYIWSSTIHKDNYIIIINSHHLPTIITNNINTIKSKLAAYMDLPSPNNNPSLDFPPGSTPPIPKHQDQAVTSTKKEVKIQNSS